MNSPAPSLILIADEFRAAGWVVFLGDEPNVWIVKPNFYLSKQYFLMPCGDGWVLSLPTLLHDPEYNEALCILNRAKLKIASDRKTSTKSRAIARESTLVYSLNNCRGNMTHFVKINDYRFINFTDVRDVYIHPEGESEREHAVVVTVTFSGVDGNTDTFVGEDARKVISAVQSLSMFNNIAIQETKKVIDNITNPPDELTS